MEKYYFLIDLESYKVLFIHNDKDICLEVHKELWSDIKHWVIAEAESTEKLYNALKITAEEIEEELEDDYIFKKINEEEEEKENDKTFQD